MKADIKIWILTGDKQETAINIGIIFALFGGFVTGLEIIAVGGVNFFQNEKLSCKK